MENKFEQMNAKKAKAEKNIIIGGLLVIIGIIIYFIVSSSTESPAFLVFVFIFVIAGIVFLGMGGSSFSNIKKDFKLHVLKEMIEEILPGSTYNPNNGLGPDVVYQTEFLKRADRFYSEDFISGTVEGVRFISSDVKLEERHVQHTKNGTRVYYVTFFLGRVFKFEFNKDFVGELQVLESGSPISRYKYDKVKLESVDFNKKFRTFATNDLTAFYILTPDIMEAIFKIERRNPGTLKLSFHDGSLYMGINNNKDTFELQLFRKIDKSLLEEFKRDLLVIKDLIVTLKLNNKLFKK